MIRTAIIYVMIDKCLDTIFSVWDKIFTPMTHDRLKHGIKYSHVRLIYSPGYQVDVYNATAHNSMTSTSTRTTSYTRRDMRLEMADLVYEKFCPKRLLDGGDHQTELAALCNQFNGADPALSISGCVFSKSYDLWVVGRGELRRDSFNSTILTSGAKIEMLLV